MTQASTHSIDWSYALEQHKPWLQRVLRSRIGNRHEVEDLFQEIALAVFRQSSQSSDTDEASLEIRTKGSVPSDPEKVAPWLYRLAVRQAVNFHRKTNRKSHAKPASDLEVFSTAPQPLEWMLAQEQQRNLKQGLAELKPQEREVLTLKYTENWSYRQMASRLGVPIRTIEYRLLSARKRLRQILTRLGAVNEISSVSKP